MRLTSGQGVDRYRIEAAIAETDFAEVYRVTHAWLGSQHALKLLNVKANEPMRDALLTEGRTMAALSHRNVVRVTDALACGELPAIVMDWVDGPSLADWLADLSRPLPLSTVVRLFDGVLAGVGHAHDAGVIHRDLKPENILLARTTAGLVPRVADFGMAKVQDLPGLSSLYVRFGTPEYMAPEVIRVTGRATARSDLFALGVILYELLTQRLPFDGSSPAAVMQAVLGAEYPDPDSLRPHLPPGVVQVVRSLLANEPERRPSSCREVRAALAPWHGSS